MSSGKCRVVVADDVVYFRTLLRLALNPERFEIVAEAGDGREAIAAAKETKPDVILLDVSMPVMDGLQAIPAIREFSPHTKILVLSGFDAHSISTEALKQGADAFLEKGVDLDEITRAITDLFDGGEV